MLKPALGGHSTHDLGMAMDLGLNDYVNGYYQSAKGLRDTPAITIPADIEKLPKAWDNGRAITLSALLPNDMKNGGAENNQRAATRDFLSLYWATKNDIKQLDANGNSGSEWAIVNGETDAEKRFIQTALFRGAGKNLKPDSSVSLISQVLIGEEKYNTYANTIKKALDQLGIPNKASAGNHYNHFHLYFKPPAPVQFGTQNLLAQADISLPGEVATATDVSVAPPLILAEAPMAEVVKYDRIANDCLLASIIDDSSDHPIMVATGQYAHNYEAIQKLKPAKVEVVRSPRYGILTPYTTVISDGKEVPSDMSFELKSTNPNYLGPDLAEYAVELKNGKRVLVRTHIYWVNRDSDLISKCPPSKFEMQEMREIQKRKSGGG